ncbi:FKBP-type peptidyl-prolyl cis-trans isomerase [Phytohalomonas tamaricis]|uniref:FKBP-type peptidyl-prolyl cis-trans isomerase n=1 Tax=Phytohalomonas tamaricis TaxID=2081032 RepID=UPI000D0BB864|nr:peptidylprolyl isomerase [Phytohalomonas tamaricis]
MSINMHRVVSLHYLLSDEGGQLLDNTRARNMPLHYLHGHNNIVAGLEMALDKHGVGETLCITLTPERAYGARNEALVQKVARNAFDNATHLEHGMRFQAGMPGNERVVTVVDINEAQVTVDANHPLAGKTLVYEVEILAIREATRDELAVGHPLEPSISHRDVEGYRH